MTPLDDILAAYTAGVGAVDPAALVRQEVRRAALPSPFEVLAVGKAAPQMVWGLVEAGIRFRGLGVAPHGARAPQVEGFRWLSGDHPVPGDASFAAGREVLAWAQQVHGDVLVLLSGGASACMEAPAPDTSVEQVVQAHRDALRLGQGITEANRLRAQVSAIKAGGLGRALLARGVEVRCWLLQDTPEPRTVGSGPLDVAGIEHVVLADGGTMAAAAGLRLATRGFSPYRTDAVDGPLEEALDRFVHEFASLERPAALVTSGEPWIAVPADAPAGGRNQHAALAAAGVLERHGLDATFVALASDGIDGSTAEAGAYVTRKDAAPGALARFDAHRELDGRGRTIRTGATGTNVGDLWMLLQR